MKKFSIGCKNLLNHTYKLEFSPPRGIFLFHEVVKIDYDDKLDERVTGNRSEWQTSENE